MATPSAPEDRRAAFKAVLLLFGPTLALLPVAAVWNPVVMKALSPDGVLNPSTELRLHGSSIIFAAAGLLSLLAALWVWKTGRAAALAGRTRLVTTTFVVMANVALLAVLDAVLGNWVLRNPLDVRGVPHGVRSHHYVPAHDRLFHGTSLAGKDSEHVLSNGRAPGANGRRRIVFVGDSVVYGWGIPAEKTIPSRLAEKLGPEFEVFNSGVEGYSFAHYVYQAKHVAALGPERMLLGVSLDDITYSRGNRLDGPLSDPRTRAQQETLLNRMYWSASSWSMLLNPRRIASRLIARKAVIQDMIVEDVVKLPDRPEVFEESKMIADRYLASVVDFANERGIAVDFVVFPFRFQLEPDADAVHPKHRALQDMIREIGRAHRVRVVDMLDPLAAQAKTMGVPAKELFLDYDHISVAGAEASANVLAEVIRGSE